jgi:RPA family protein
VGVRIARHCKRVNITGVDASDAQARSNRIAWKTRIVLDATKSFLFHSGNEFTIAQQRRRDVAVVGIDAQNDHQM